MRVEWDDPKDTANQQKHGISFEQASQLFTSGADYLEILDADHSIDEDRFICIGPLDRAIVVVITTEPEEDVIRIISARWATKREEELFAAYVKGRTP